MPISPNLIGVKFTRLTVLKKEKANNHGKIMWLCLCDCGNKSHVSTGSLNSKSIMSCGCLRRERIKESLTKHSSCGSKVYNTWRAMTYRCSCKNGKNYKDYGGRGITVCKDWLNASNFIKWATSNGYCEGLQIDRINNDGNYEPSNCRFVNARDNVLNQRLLKSSNTTGYTGVYWYKTYGKYVTKISVNKKSNHLGYSNTKKEALKKRNDFIIENNLEHEYKIQLFKEE